jgi:hypothetical protein
MSIVRPEEVLKFTKPTEGLSLPFKAVEFPPFFFFLLSFSFRLVFLIPSPLLLFTGYLCPLSANIYGIDFTSFRIRDMDTGHVIFEVNSDPANTPTPDQLEQLGDAVRFIQYDFGADFLNLRTIGTK